MCGLAGILRTDGGHIPETWLDAMLESIRHRGPDGSGRYRDEVSRDGRVIRLAMVHARLAIIDPEDGAQPMVDEGVDQEHGGSMHSLGAGDTLSIAAHRRAQAAASTLAVCFNGCIYNHRVLRRELTDAGHRFRTDHSDTEVLLKGYRAWGEALPGRLEGMFAYALWERDGAVLTLARDRCGEKPLYWWSGTQEGGHLLVFGSSVTAVIRALQSAYGEAFPPMDTMQIRQTLVNGYSSGGTPWVGLQEAPRAGYVRIEAAKVGMGALSGRRYWTGTQGGTRTRLLHLSESTAEELLRRSVRERMEADVPLGCFLSGGVDSSLVAAFAQEAMTEEGKKLQTFTLRMPEAEYDESKIAEQVAVHLGTEHVTLSCQPSPAEDLERLIGLLGMPFGDASILPTYWLSREAKKHVKVALAGEGGDELFLGYERYRAISILKRWGWLLSLTPTGCLNRAEEKSHGHRLWRLATAAVHGGYADLVRIFPTPMVATLFGREATGDLSRYRSLELALDHDFRSYLPGDLLRKVDTASMAAALEVRCPFLDSNVIEATLSAPPETLMPHGELKGLLKAIARRRLPLEAVDRPKMGFAVPIGRWFRSDFGGMRQLLLDRLNEPGSYVPLPLSPESVQWIIREHMEERVDHGHRLFGLLTLAIWNRLRRAASHGCSGGGDQTRTAAGSVAH